MEKSEELRGLLSWVMTGSRLLRQAPLGEVAVYQPYPSPEQSAGPERPAVPAPVRTAVKLMYAGAAVWTVLLISGLVLIISGSKAGHAMVNGHTLTAAQASQAKPILITVAIVSGLVAIALWLWMARANGQGRNWARILSTVLFGLATLQMIDQASVQPGKSWSHVGVGVLVLFVIVPVLGWLVGLAAVWLLWRPASSEFFKPRGVTQAGSGAQLSSRMNASRDQLPRRL
jgi:hypothetical protein